MNTPEPTIQNILDSNTLRWIFVGGKGGVGKTTCSCSIAVQMAKVRERVLILSTDPAHNLSDAFDQKFSKNPTKVRGFNNLFAMEIDPNVNLGEFEEDLVGFEEAAVSADIRKTIGHLMTSFPGVDEYMSYTEVFRLVRNMDYSVVIFDTAPTGHTLRLLAFPEAMEKSLSKVVSMKNQFAPILNQLMGLVGMNSTQGGDLTNAIETRLPIVKEITKQFKDSTQTTFVCVCIPEFLSMYETERLVQSPSLKMRMGGGGSYVSCLPPTVVNEIHSSFTHHTIKVNAWTCLYFATKYVFLISNLNIGLLQLCDFIEDCEHVKLTQRILHLLGREGPYLKRPRQFTRYIYNRVMLESAPIKCTATTALARFAAHNEELLPSILVLLKRIMIDEDDEVRDRAAFYHYILSHNQVALKSAYLLSEEMHLSPSGLERALLDYVHNSHTVAGSPFSLATVPIADIVQPNDLSSAIESDVVKIKAKSNTMAGEGRNASLVSQMSGKRIQDSFAEQLASIPEFSGLGSIFKSSSLVELTESDTEYVVTCIKHLFSRHLVLQFDCVNTMADQVLENVYVSCEPDDPMFNIVCTVPCKSLKYNSPAVTYVLVELPEDLECHSATFINILKFTIKDIDSDPSDPGLPDEYQLEDLVLGISDHIQRVSKQNFTLAWQELSPETEVEETYMLVKHKTIKETMRQIIDHLGLQPCDQTDHMPHEGKSSHQLLLSGVYRGGYQVLALCKLAKVLSDASLHSNEQGVTFQITVRSSDPVVSRIIADAIG
uniref:Coatomer subunit gamma-2 n=1 Tax=Schistosoma haematobium TaxID=6185 RepID=A0A095A1A0_SCHHA